MDTTTFLDAILPQQGRRCVGALKGKVFRNFFGSSNEWLLSTATGIDKAGHDAYFALGGFGPEDKRTQDSVVALRSAWLDIDTRENKPGEVYADRKDALRALADFVQTVGLPRPWVVSSGYGLHVYFPFDRDLAPPEWQRVSSALKYAVNKFGLAVDPSRTTDHASVLRVPGTRNRKGGGDRTVKIVQAGETTDADEFVDILQEYAPVALTGTVLGPRPRHLDTSINSDLEIQYDPSDAEKVATHCAQVGAMRSTRGNLSQPLWYAGIGVVAHCEDGEATCQAWSLGHPDYSDDETSAKVGQALKFGPTTCAKFESLNPSGCDGCPHRGKITSPIQLGTEVGEPQVIQVTRSPFGDGDGEVTTTLTYPEGFGWGTPEGIKGPCLWKRTGEPGEDGQWVWDYVPIADINFYPVERIRSDDGTYGMLIHMTDKQQSREFMIPARLIGEGGGKLAAELAGNEVNVKGNSRNAVGEYLSAWIGKLRDEYAATPSLKNFGWWDDTFVIGERRLIPGQSVGKAIISGDAASFARWVHKKGTLPEWVEAVDQLYNRPDSEPLQYCILTAFAAPLFSLFGSNGGVTVYAHSQGSGYGKTTAQKVGLSAWGNPEDMLLTDFTNNALFKHIGVMGNLPVVIDEMTNAPSAFVSELVYTMSTGRGKARLTQGAAMAPTLNWATLCMGSGNATLTEKLSAHRTNAQGEMMRVFEFTLTKKEQVDSATADDIVAKFNDNYGHAGEVFMDYVVNNREAVKATLIQMRKRLIERLGGKQEERYWRTLHACVLTALGICRQLGLVQFNPAGLISWIEHETSRNRAGSIAAVRGALEVFGDMLNDLWKGVLVTHGEGNLQSGSVATVVGGQYPIGTVVGRHIHPIDANSREVLYLSRTVAKKWCESNGASFKELDDALIAAGWVKPQPVRVSLGKGVDKYAGMPSTRCWEIDPVVYRRLSGGGPLAQKLAVVQGDADDGTREASA